MMRNKVRKGSQGSVRRKGGARRRRASHLAGAARGRVSAGVTPLDTSELPGADERPTGPDESWRHIATARLGALDPAIPAYLLDKNYFFLDWNVAFDVLVAGPLGLKRGQNHAGDFVARLKNVHDVFERSKRVFEPGRAPLVDTEPLVFESPRYGEIEFQKLAAQIIDENAEVSAWIVYLNVSRAGQGPELWRDVARRIDEDLHWARYAVSYDKLLLNFDADQQLVSSIVERLQPCERCLDLGAGTGNGTLALLETNDQREVWAVESNYTMIRQLLDKIALAERRRGADYFRRLHLLKEDILRLQELGLAPGHFDGAMLINVLYLLEDAERCLRQVHALLQPGGRLVISTPHDQTDVNRLFQRMRESLVRKGLFERLRPHYDDARARHDAMMDRIHRDTKEDIRRYIEGAGFRITDWQDRAYADSVVIVEAVKD
jgi:SAM-dependent methyltransferase